MFQHTGNISYLETSRRMASYFLTYIPSDGIVPWSVPLCISSSDYEA